MDHQATDLCFGSEGGACLLAKLLRSKSTISMDMGYVEFRHFSERLGSVGAGDGIMTDPQLEQAMTESCWETEGGWKFPFFFF